MSAVRSTAGRLPLRLRVGVTGHRVIEDVDGCRALVDQAIEHLLRATADSGCDVELTVVSPLAEGADRLIVERVLARPDATLEVPLPLALDDYRADFEGEGSRDEFDALLRTARIVVPPPTTRTRNHGYERVGSFVVDRSDALIAVWDGRDARGRGGTAQIVDRARSKGMPVCWILPGSPSTLTFERADAVAPELLAAAKRFNQGPPNQQLVERAVAEGRGQLVPDLTALEPVRLRETYDWIAPYFERADQVATRLRRTYDRGTRLIVGAGAVSVASAALHAEVWPHQSLLIVLEVLCLVVIGAQFLLGRARRIHARWVGARFLAERFRSAYFLAAAGLGRRFEGGLDVDLSANSEEEWARRAFAAVWDRRPEGAGSEDDVRATADHLAATWLGAADREGTGQIGYHRRQGESLERAHHLAFRALVAIFGLVFAAAVLHLFIHDEDTSAVLSVLSLSLPAVGAAVAALAADREYSRHAERYVEMSERLTNLREDVLGVATAAELQDAAARIEQVMLEENRDWVGVLRFHDFEPHS